tara:strand:- start:351 stop:641 length:291 start_codon:yes stop_codon:yes gene_type:complete
MTTATVEENSIQDFIFRLRDYIDTRFDYGDDTIVANALECVYQILEEQYIGEPIKIQLPLTDLANTVAGANYYNDVKCNDPINKLNKLIKEATDAS